MAFDPNLDPKTLRELNLEASKILGTFQSMSDALSKAAKEASVVTGESAKIYKSQTSAAETLAKKLSGLTKSQLKGLNLRKQLQSDLLRLEQETTIRQSKMAELQEQIGARIRDRIEYEDELLRLQEEGASRDELSEVEDIISAIKVEEGALLKVLEVLSAQEEESDRLTQNFKDLEQTASNMANVNPFTGMSAIMKDIPVLNKLFPGLTKAADRFNAELAKSNDGAKALRKTILDIEFPEKGLKGFTKGLLDAKGIIPDIANGLAAFTVGSAVDGIKRLDAASVELEKSLNMNTTEAINLQKSFIETANTIPGLTAEHLNKSLLEANGALGTTAAMSMETLSTFATMTKQMGITADEAGKLNQFSLATGQNFQDFTNEAIGSVKVLNAVNGTAIDYKDILKDVNSMSNAVKLSTNAQGKNLAEAAYQAKKMGLSMGELDSIAGGLLDFEQSIANELEAELLLGRDLNLEKARAAALDNDLVKMGEELQKQGITKEKFGKMNRIEQESIAKAMGMTRDSMADMFVKQEALNALSVKGATTVDEAVKKKYEEAMAIEDVKKREAALKALRETEGAKEITRQLEAQTAAEKAMQAQIQIADNLAKAFPTEAIEGMKNAMDKLAKYIPALTIAIGALTAAILVMKGLKMGMEIKQMIKGFKGAGGAADDLAKAVKNVGGNVDDVAKTAANSMDDVAKAVTGSADDAMKAASTAVDDAAKAMTAGLDDVAKSGSKLGGIFKSFKGLISGALGSIKNLAKGIGEAVGKAGNLAKNLVSAGGGAAGAASAVGGGAGDAAKAATSAAKGGGAAVGAAGKAAKGGGGLFGKVFSGAKNLVGKATSMAGEALDAVNPMTHVKKFFKGGGVSKLLKKLPGIGQLIGPALALFEVSQAAGGSADPREVGNATLSALGGLGGGALGSILGSLIPVPVVGTMLGGMAGDYIGRMVADLVSENVDMSSLGQMAIDVFGGQTDTEGISPSMAENTETGISSDTASDFISRPGQPIQKFRPDDIVIGATNPMGGGSGDNARTVELLERLVAAVEKGGVINMDGNKVGTVLGMSSYKTQ